MRSIFPAIVCLLAYCHAARAEVRYNVTELWSPDASEVFVADINNRGETVGSIQRQGTIPWSGFLHIGNGPMELPDLKVMGDITSINNSGQYVGTAEGRYFRHSGTSPVSS